ncbi:Protein of unknown function [Lactobacillus delbrueckii subsp. bulgaricus]|nr:Protein of unknown function [Lactobacillus delbrueckii subsp. bulgaricus]CDR74210.1 Protein of unknown function [Lactobacillus delbrueckii subsp. bulgaricus]CDR76483.1 Putative uncharacterized protein [Lactobacillus delbrueckii subsp. lactis]CDR79703.1 Protein of unknown function [Lactobacillus delbrueckii subsp. lactis]CDR82759.1 Protein of unknown function [Lactobacillus delbrueckii subsp. lactis]
MDNVAILLAEADWIA